jgi:hypothetical protein
VGGYGAMFFACSWLLNDRQDSCVTSEAKRLLEQMDQNDRIIMEISNADSSDLHVSPATSTPTMTR